MLLKLTVENFRSYRQPRTLDLVADPDETELPDQLAPIPDSDESALRILAIYGANNSGKSNLLLALKRLKQAVVDTKDNDATELLGREFCSPNTPSTAKIEPPPVRLETITMVDGAVYRYGLRVDMHAVIEEWLYTLLADDSEELIFHRNRGAVEETVWGDFGNKLSDKDRDNLLFIARGCPREKLLLNEATWRNVDVTNQQYRWFRDQLVVVSADMRDARTDSLINEKKLFFKGLIEDYLGNPEPLAKLAKLLEIADTNIVAMDARILSQYGSASEGTPYALIAHHKDPATQHTWITNFPYHESEGTHRLALLLYPLVSAADNSAQVWLIDELDRSFHPHLAEFVLQQYADSGDNRQLIFTTHNTHLMRPGLIRRDAIWIVDQRPDSGSQFHALSNFQRRGFSPEEGYLAGRYGGVPMIAQASLQLSKQS